jgi:hypothetical protein
MKKAIALLFVLLAPVSLMAQASVPAAAQATEMKKLGFLVGRWKGEGWVSYGAGQKRTFTIEEKIESRLDGQVLVVEGLGKNAEGATVHHAFAIASYDKEAKVYRWRAFRADGSSMDAEPRVGENSLIWGFRDPRAGEIRFTIRLNEKGQWFEIGEISRDGKTWMKFLEMTLSRIP